MQATQQHPEPDIHVVATGLRTDPRRVRHPRNRALDLVFGLGGLLFGTVSLSYPFGHDQGVHWYVAREWLTRGALPYRDTFDYKTPGIFLVHAAAIAIGGEGQRAIRVAELLCVLVLGVLVGRVASDPRERLPGMTGLGVLVTAILYFGYFSYWDTAQCEIWAALFVFASLAAAMRIERWWLAMALAGLFGGLAMLMKPPVGLLLTVVGWRLYLRRERPLAWAIFGCGLMLPWLVIASIFAAKDALHDVWDVMVFANVHYVLDARRIDSFGAWFDESVNVFATFNPFSSMLVVLLAMRARSATFLRDHGLPLGLALACYVSILLQMKFYRYHFGVLVPVVAMLVLQIVGDYVRKASRARRAVGFAGGIVVAAFFLSGSPAHDWRLSNGEAFAYWLHRSSREQFIKQFSSPALYYSQTDSEGVGQWLRSHAAPGDEVAVRGFEPEIYQLSGMHFSGRFFWTVPLVDPRRTYNRDAWLGEDARALARSPRFVVALRDLHTGLEAAETFEQRGYTRRTTIGRLVILEHL